MQALEIEGQTDQSPLTSGSKFPTQGELAEAKYLLNDPDDWFDGAFADPIDGLADGSLELVSHLHLWAGILGWGIGKGGEAVFPTAMMGITTSSNVGVNATLGTSRERGLTKVARIQSGCRWGANDRGDGLKGRFSFVAIIGMIGEGVSHDKELGLIHGNLHIVILLKSGIGRIFHDAGLWVSEVVLVPIAWSWHRWLWWATWRALSHLLLPLCSLGHLDFILCLFGCCPLGSTSLQHFFGFCQSLEAGLSAGNLVAEHQSIRNLFGPLGYRKEVFDLGSKVGLYLQQTLPAHCFVLGGISMHLGPIQTDVADLKDSCLLRQQQHLHEQILDLGQKGAPKGG